MDLLAKYGLLAGRHAYKTTHTSLDTCTVYTRLTRDNVIGCQWANRSLYRCQTELDLKDKVLSCIGFCKAPPTPLGLGP